MKGFASAVISLGSPIFTVPLARKLGINLEHGTGELFTRNIRNVTLATDLIDDAPEIQRESPEVTSLHSGHLDSLAREGLCHTQFMLVKLF